MVTLKRWYNLMGINPWHGYQLAGTLVPLDSRCNSLVYEYAYQNANRAGRREIRESIERAYSQFKTYAHFEPRTTYKTVTIPYPKLADYMLQRFTANDDQGRWLSLKLPDGYIQQLGVEQSTFIASVSLTFQDLNSDGLFETATCTATVPSGTTAQDIQIRFASADLFDDSDATIDPRSISVVGTTATITLDSYTLVRPILYTGINSQGYDPSVLPPTAGSPYASAIDVYTVECNSDGYTLNDAQAVLVWQSRPLPALGYSWLFNTSTTDPSSAKYAIARGGIRNAEQGIVYIGQSVYDATSGTFSGRLDFSNCAPPDQVIIRYKCGVSGTQYDQTIARLAAAELAKPICACEPANKTLGEWQFDLARTGASDEIYQTPGDADNPLGSRRGHIFAWRTIQQVQRVSGILA